MPSQLRNPERISPSQPIDGLGSGPRRPGGRQLRIEVTPRGCAVFTVSGQTLTPDGAPMASMDVALFRTGNLELVSRGTSDGSGNYVLTTPDNAGHFFVASFHPDGSVAGITRNVLVATQV